MKRKMNAVAQILLVIVFVCVILLAVLYVQGRPGTERLKWHNAESNIYGIAICLERYRALNNEYPRSLPEVKKCLSSGGWSSSDPWNEEIVFEIHGLDRYSLAGCLAGSPCWEYVDKYFAETVFVDHGLELDSGTWVFPTRRSSPNHRLSAAIAVRKPLYLDISVETSFFEETEWSRTISSQPSYGFTVYARRIHLAQNVPAWKSDSFQEGEVIWQEKRSTGWNGKNAEAKVLLGTCPKGSRVLLDVLHNGAYERTISDNFALIDCP